MRDRYERRHRFTRWDHPRNVLAHTPPGVVEAAWRAHGSLWHAMTVPAGDETTRCTDPECPKCRPEPGAAAGAPEASPDAAPDASPDASP